MAKNLVPAEAATRAKDVPPASTRAAIRGEFVRVAHAARRDYTVDWVHLRLNDESGRAVALKDPFATSHPQAETLIAGLEDHPVIRSVPPQRSGTTTRDERKPVRTKVLSAIAAGLLLLSACGQGEESQDSTTPPPSVSAQDAKSTSLDDITVEGKKGKKPKVSFDSPLVIEKAEKKVLEKGTGEKIADGEQVTAQMTLVSGTNGKIVESSYDSQAPAGFPMDKSQISEDLYNALIDVKVGSRVMMSLNGSAEQGEASQTLVYIIDVEKTTRTADPRGGEEGRPVGQPGDGQVGRRRCPVDLEAEG